jgi:uncharacterized protein YdhG (YjbR/CyaY superfamily)
VDNEVMRYINDVQDSRRELFLKLHNLVLKLYPDIGMKVSYNIPKYSYSNDEWVFVSYNKQGVTLHVGYKGNIPEFSARYPKFKTGKACVHFKPKDDIPWQDVEALIKQAVK